MSDHDPRRDPLDSSLRPLRDLRAPDGLFEAALRRIDAPERPRTPAPPRIAPWISALLTLSPVVATVAVLALAFHETRELEEFSHAREIELVMPSEGDAVTELALATHHHDDPAHVQMDVPEGVSVSFNDAGTRASMCAQTRCVHRWSSSVPAAHGPVRVGVSGPGRYVIHVAHESHGTRVRERIVLNARRR